MKDQRLFLYGAMPPNHQDFCVRAHVAHDLKLQRRGRAIIAKTLQSGKAATTTRAGFGKLSITDGPFAETKEQLGRVY